MGCHPAQESEEERARMDRSSTTQLRTCPQDAQARITHSVEADTTTSHQVQTREAIALLACIMQFMEFVKEEWFPRQASRRDAVEEFVLDLSLHSTNLESLPDRINGVIAYLYCFKDLLCTSPQPGGSSAESVKTNLAAMPTLYDKLELCVLCHAQVAVVNPSSPPETIVLRSLLDRDLPLPHTYRKVMEGETESREQDWGENHIAQRVCDGWYTLRPANGDVQSTTDRNVVGCWNPSTSNIRVSTRRGTHESNKAGMVFRRLMNSSKDESNVLLVDTSLCPCEQTEASAYVWWNNYSVCLKISSRVNRRGLAWAHPVHREPPAGTLTGQLKIRAIFVANLPADNVL